MRNILLTISYDGTDFCGWQRQDFSANSTIPNNEKKRSLKLQPQKVSTFEDCNSACVSEPFNKSVSPETEVKISGDISDADFKRSDSIGSVRTVQAEVEAALEKLHKQKITLYGSGRTDSGVHAFGQAANFFSPIDSIPVENYPRALNAFLPPDIRIMSAVEKPDDFNARYSATSRSYRYFINFSDAISASQNRYVWNVKNYKPNLERLNKLCECLNGEIDCASFAASGDESVSTCRYLEDAHFFLEKDMFGNELLVFQIEANAFLWKMVRTLTGTIVNLDKENASPESLKKILEAKDRTIAGVTAPPTGLFLWEVKFDGIRRHA